HRLKALNTDTERLELPPRPPPTGLSDWVLIWNPSFGLQCRMWAWKNKRSGSLEAKNSDRFLNFQVFLKSMDSIMISDPVPGVSSQWVQMSMDTLMVVALPNMAQMGHKSKVPPARSK